MRSDQHLPRTAMRRVELHGRCQLPTLLPFGVLLSASQDVPPVMRLARRALRLATVQHGKPPARLRYATLWRMQLPSQHHH